MLSLLCFVALSASLGASHPHTDVGLCSQVYLMHQYCTSTTDDTSVEGYADLQTRVEKLEDLATWYHASNGYHYKLFRTALNYAGAKAKCIENGGILASVGPRDPEIRRELINLVKQRGTSNVWIGANDIQTNGRWVWEDGTVASGNDIDWIRSPQQPDNSGGVEACAHMMLEYAWTVNDYRCSVSFPFLCEKLVE